MSAVAGDRWFGGQQWSPRPRRRTLHYFRDQRQHQHARQLAGSRARTMCAPESGDAQNSAWEGTNAKATRYIVLDRRKSWTYDGGEL
jgi:hypothetical protein